MSPSVHPADNLPAPAEETAPTRARPAALAGVSYQPDADDLTRLVDSLLALADLTPVPGRTIALLVPHAALIPVPFSGAVAAAAYRQVQGSAVERVVVLAPSHHRHDGAVLLPDADAYTTPLGLVPVDSVLLADVGARLGKLARTVAEEKEHAIEIQLPFLQRCLGRFRLVPLLLERQTMDCAIEVARALVGGLKTVGGTERTLLVASSDLSHGHPSDAARRLDREFLNRVRRLDAESLYAAVQSSVAEACGIGAVAAMLIAAFELGARDGRLLRYSTSGDVTGDYRHVVGYAALHFSVDDNRAFGGGREAII